MAIDSIGNAVFERHLCRWGRYKEFRDECREYYDDISAYMKAKKEQQKLERELEASASNMVRKPQQLPSTPATIPKDTKNPKKAKTTNTKQSNKPKEHEHKNQKVTTKTVSATVVRKGKGSKPAYVSLPFLEVNIVDVQVARAQLYDQRVLRGSQDTKQQGTRGTGKKKTWKGKNSKYGKGPAKEKSEGGVKVVEKSE
ncbi:hypothetical protein VTN00DRAFT_1813 [Thermoascus crustaceus]|uniref:uncharacterized protein n=1 Tax=Thermoascus crustaceus TaxID=5088 RepID=UPI003742C498